MSTNALLSEEQWADEQRAAEENRPPYKIPGIHLQPEAASALGTKSPALAWLEITDLLTVAVEEQWEDAQKLGQELGIGGYWTEPKNLSELCARATSLSPLFAVNEFVHVNPEVRLSGAPLSSSLTPLEALRGVIRMWTANNHRNEAL